MVVMEKYDSIGQSSRILGVSIKTLRMWHQIGKLVLDILTKGQQHRCSEACLCQLLGHPLPDSDKLAVLYTRIFCRGQKGNLNHQVASFEQFFIETGIGYDDIWMDTGNNLTYRWPYFRQLVTDHLAGRLQKVVVTHKDRLARFGYELIEDILAQMGGVSSHQPVRQVGFCVGTGRRFYSYCPALLRPVLR